MPNLTFYPTLLDILYDPYNKRYVQLFAGAAISQTPINDWFTCKDLSTNEILTYSAKEYDLIKVELKPAKEILTKEQIVNIHRLEDDICLTAKIIKRKI